MDGETFKKRTKKFALDTIALVGSLPNTRAADVIGRQLLRSATSVGANYRAACRARSPADLLSKLKIVEEESDESVYWLELLSEGAIIPVQAADPLKKEANEIVAMTVASLKTIRSRSARA